MPVRGRPGGRLIFLSVDFIVFVCNNFFVIFAYNNCKGNAIGEKQPMQQHPDPPSHKPK
jgi:hypothetical protein